jgi:hypothetical protein
VVVATGAWAAAALFAPFLVVGGVLIFGCACVYAHAGGGFAAAMATFAVGIAVGRSGAGFTGHFYDGCGLMDSFGGFDGGIVLTGGVMNALSRRVVEM